MEEVGDVLDKFLPILCIEHLVVGVANVESVAAEVLIEELVLKLVFVSFFVFIDPVAWVFLFDVGGH